jgi:hypothetical protein
LSVRHLFRPREVINHFDQGGKPNAIRR